MVEWFQFSILCICMKVLKEPSIFDECKVRNFSCGLQLEPKSLRRQTNWDFDLLDWAFRIETDKHM